MRQPSGTIRKDKTVIKGFLGGSRRKADSDGKYGKRRVDWNEKAERFGCRTQRGRSQGPGNRMTRRVDSPDKEYGDLSSQVRVREGLATIFEVRDAEEMPHDGMARDLILLVSHSTLQPPSQRSRVRSDSCIFSHAAPLPFLIQCHASTHTALLSCTRLHSPPPPPCHASSQTALYPLFQVGCSPEQRHRHWP